jgi:hypothetical protein
MAVIFVDADGTSEDWTERIDNLPVEPEPEPEE